MGYRQAKSDLRFMHEYKAHVIDYLNAEYELEQNRLHYDPRIYQEGLKEQIVKQSNEFQTLRQTIVRETPRANRVGSRVGASTHITCFPAPVFANNPVIKQSIFDGITRDMTYDKQITPQMVLDCLNETIGLCEERVQTELSHLKNPFYWLKSLFTFILRIPFMLIEATGFDVGKVEDHFIAKLFKLIEVIVILYVLFRLGAGNQGLIQVLKKLAANI